MQYTLFWFFLSFGIGLNAQSISNLPLHEQESFYSEFRREKIKTTLADFEAHGEVKSITSVYDMAPTQTNRHTEQRFSFSKEGLLTAYSLNDTADASKKTESNQYAESRTFRYNQAGQLETLRVAEFAHGARTYLYWQRYNAEGYLASAWKAEPYARSTSSSAIHYVYTVRDSVLSVTTSPFMEYDVTGNVIADSVHFIFDHFGRVISERAFRFGGSEEITFAWNDDCSFHYSIHGRSYMEEWGARTCNAAGKLIRTTSSGHYINQQGTNYYTHEDSLVYNEWGWISRMYRQSPKKTSYELNEMLFLPAGAKAQSNPPPTAQPKPEFVYTYIVDSRGNWTSRFHYNAEGILIGTETREIVYY